jgi:hypothetical protein
MKKKITNRKAKLLTTLLAAATTMSMATPMIASAHNVYDESAGNLTEVVGEATPGYQEVSIPVTATAEGVEETSMALSENAALKSDTAALSAGQKSERYRKQVERLERRKRTKVKVLMDVGGYYVVKRWKLYGRKVTGVKENGDYILGKWEVLEDDTNVSDFDDTTVKTITAEYVQLAFSADILGGTDFPYSEVFWNSLDREIREVTIQMTGGCRTVDVSIKVVFTEQDDFFWKYETIIDKNCSAHKEWTP